MKLFVVHSKAYASMYEPFAKSVHEKTSFEFMPQELPSRFDGCYYGMPIYYEMLKWLVEWRVHLVNTETEIFVNVGADSEFYADPVPTIHEHIEGRDIVAADDSPGAVYPRLDGPSKMCSCFQVVRPGPTVKALFAKVLDDPRIGYDVDDPILNENRSMIRWACLPHNMFWNPFTWLNPRRVWTMNDPIPQPPKELVWFHANCVVGLDGKRHLLKTVHQKFYECIDK